MNEFIFKINKNNIKYIRKKYLIILYNNKFILKSFVVFLTKKTFDFRQKL